MIKLKAIYPPFAAAFPVLAVFSANLTLCPLRDLWQPLGIAVGVALLAWLIAGLLSQSVTRGAAAATVVVISCFTYSPVAKWITDATAFDSFGIWVGGTLLLSALAAWKWRWHRPLNVLSVFLVLTSVGSIILGYVRIGQDEARLAPATRQGGSTTASRPDVYYIILDGYGRADQLKRVMHYDDSSFLAELEGRGFYVASGAHSNYVQTELSLASSLNMEFLPTLLPHQSIGSDDRAPLDTLSSQNAVVRYFRSVGYEYIAITTGFPSLQFNEADLKLGQPHRISLLASTLAAMTPLSIKSDIAESEYAERRDLLAAAFSNLGMVGSATSAKPRFVFVHVLAPHPPFVVNADGSYNSNAKHGPFGYWDGSDYMDFGNTPIDYRSGYVRQVEYVNNRTLAVLDTILSKSSESPLILIQGDHGSKLGLSQNSLAKTDINECMSNLMAYRVSDEIRAKLYPTITPVNSFRIILSTLFGASLPNLPDRSWYSTFKHPYAFMEVTNRLGGSMSSSAAGAKNSARKLSSHS